MRVFLKVEGLQGDSADDRHRDWIDLVNVRQTITSAAFDPRQQGMLAGSPPLTYCTIVKAIDSASPRLYEACCDGRQFRTAVIEYCTSAENVTRLSLSFTELVVAHVRTWITKTGEARESFRLYYTKVEWRYTRSSAAGSAGRDIVGSWNHKSAALDEEEQYALVRVFYATDRACIQRGEDVDFGTDRSAAGNLSYGTCEVSIPRDHRLGSFERPCIWKLEFGFDPEKHITLLRTTLDSYNGFISSVRTRVSASARKEALVFIHGYNVTFEDAARRTAQMAYDLAFDGAPIFYSWPSQGRTHAYVIDETNVEWTVPHLEQFLTDISTNSGAEVIHVIAHSMGNRAVASTLRLLALRHTTKLPCIRHLVMAAPDIDADSFCQLALDFNTAVERTTVYASERDQALRLSRTVHGHTRAGGRPSVIPGVDVVDASAVDTSFVGHSYYGSNRSVLSDIFWLLRDDKPPRDRFGIRVVDADEGRHYFAFQP